MWCMRSEATKSKACHVSTSEETVLSWAANWGFAVLRFEFYGIMGTLGFGEGGTHLCFLPSITPSSPLSYAGPGPL